MYFTAQDAPDALSAGARLSRPPDPDNANLWGDAFQHVVL